MNYTLDWLSGTDKSVRDKSELRAMARALTGSTQFRDAKGHYGYSVAVADANGVIFESGGRADMGTHVLASGLSLSSISLRKDGMDRLMKMINAIVPARIDLAVDTDSDWSRAFAAKLQSGDYDSRSRAWSVIESQDGGLTAYVGSRSSERFMRVYNKGAEQNLSDVPWTRIEIETKRATAKHVKGTIMARGMAEAARGWIGGFVKVDLPEFNQAIQGQAIYVPSQKGSTNTRRWLIEVCAPAMARLIAEGDESIFSDFAHAVFGDK